MQQAPEVASSVAVECEGLGLTGDLTNLNLKFHKTIIDSIYVDEAMSELEGTNCSLTRYIYHE